MSIPRPPTHVIRRQRSGPALRKTLPPSKPIYRIPYVPPATPPPPSVPGLTHTPVTPTPTIRCPGPSIATPVPSSNGQRTRPFKSLGPILTKPPADDVTGDKPDTVPSSPDTPSPQACELRKQDQRKLDVGREVPARKRRKVQSEGPGGFEEIFPRHKRLEDTGGVEKRKSRSADVVQAMLSSKCSIEMQERYGSRVCKTIEEGRKVTGLMGVKPEDEALEIMDEDEARMYQFWAGGKRRPPEEDWEALKEEGNQGAIERVWEFRAADLRKVYGVNPELVDAAAAREWWRRNDGWRPLVSALGKVRSWSQIREEEECVRAFEHFRCHREWVRESIARFEKRVEKAMWMLKKRVEDVRKSKREWDAVKGVEREVENGADRQTRLGTGPLEVELNVSWDETGETRDVNGGSARDDPTTDGNRNGVRDSG